MGRSIYLINPRADIPTYYGAEVYAGRGFAPAAFLADLVMSTLAERKKHQRGTLRTVDTDTLSLIAEVANLDRTSCATFRASPVSRCR